MHLSSEQQTLLENPISSKIFLNGLAGTGKTTAATLWLKKLLESGIPALQILVFVPQRALANPYHESLREWETGAQGLITSITLGGLARRMVDLFWPLVSQDAGFIYPNLPPQFLTLETAQYYMAHIVRPLIDEQRFFESLTINRNRIYSQILDNLNKSAVIGFPHQEIGTRLKSAWIGEIEQLHIYDDVQACVDQFRAFCLNNNLLDFSLQVEIFVKYLWNSPLCRQYLNRTYRHLIVDNLEEDTPITHDILKEWVPEFDSALLLLDDDAGYRFFLGADPQTADTLREDCQTEIHFTENQVNPPGIIQIKTGIRNAVALLQGEPEPEFHPITPEIHSALDKPDRKIKYFPEMVNWVAEQIQTLIAEGTSPGEIVVLAPFMPDVLRFALGNQLDKLGIPNQSHRPSRSLRDEPATQTMLTLAAIAFPSWNLLPKRINLALSLTQAIDGLDLVRSQLLTGKIYNQNATEFPLASFESLPDPIRDRITYVVGQRYDRLREWLQETTESETQHLDFFMSRLFGEVLSQPGFGFHNDLDSGNTIASLIESIQKFRWTVGTNLASEASDIGKEYIQMVQEGVIAAQYLHTWEDPSDNAVFLSPAYTFLISNRPVDIQFWLDIGSSSWYQRLDQPLTQPYVLSRQWKHGELWNAEDELSASYQSLYRLSLGLLSRCREKIYLGMSDLDVRGFENRGLLIRIFQHVLQKAQQAAS